MSAPKPFVRGACAPPKPSKAYVDGWDAVFGKKGATVVLAEMECGPPGYSPRLRWEEESAEAMCELGAKLDQTRYVDHPRAIERACIIDGLRAIGHAIGARDLARADGVLFAACLIERGGNLPGAPSPFAMPDPQAFDDLVAKAKAGDWPT